MTLNPAAVFADLLTMAADDLGLLPVDHDRRRLAHRMAELAALAGLIVRHEEFTHHQPEEEP